MFLALAVLNLWLAAANPVASSQSRVISLPQEEVTRMPSPDGKWTLVFECPNACSQRKLWIEDSSLHTRKLVKDYDRSLSVSWAPDSRHFFVNDAFGSDGESCSVYEPGIVSPTDIATILVAAYPGAKRFMHAGHSYVHAIEWADSYELIVVLFGHFDDPPLGGFTIRYRINLNGEVYKLSQKKSEDNPAKP